MEQLHLEIRRLFYYKCFWILQAIYSVFTIIVNMLFLVIKVTHLAFCDILSGEFIYYTLNQYTISNHLMHK